MNKREVITIIRSLLSSTNSTFGIYTLNKEFKEETGIDIPLFGYSSLSDFLQSIPETVKLTGVYPTQKVSLVNNEISGHIVSLVKRQRKDKFKGRKHSGGYFWMNDRSGDSLSDKASNGKENEMPPLVPANILLLKEEYKNKNDKVNPIIKKFNTTQKVQLNCCQKQADKSDFRFRNEKFITASSRQSEGSKNESTTSSHQSESTPEEANDANDPKLLPRTSDSELCYIRNEEDIPEIDLQLHSRVGDYVEVSPCEISHPGLFYLHLRKFKKPLAKFMDKLQKFYNEREMPNLTKTPKEREICVVFYSNNGEAPRWHRVQIQEVLSDVLVFVSFIDYGSTSKILVKQLKPLHRDFSSFPKQAVLGSLANIRPPGGQSKWSKTAIKRFHELAFCRDLVAGVVSMDYRLNIALSSTEGEEVHVNDTLVDEGLAEFDLSVAKIDKAEVEKEFDTGAILERDLACPVFYPSKNCSNSRLQKMFSVQE